MQMQLKNYKKLTTFERNITEKKKAAIVDQKGKRQFKKWQKTIEKLEKKYKKQAEKHL